MVKAGYRVAICEQVEDVSAAVGIVKREVVRVITPGTVTESRLIDEFQVVDCKIEENGARVEKLS